MSNEYRMKAVKEIAAAPAAPVMEAAPADLGFYGEDVFNAAYAGLLNGWQAFAYGKNTYLGQALDVFVQEPLPPQSPLWDCPRLLVTPHIAGNMTLAYTRQRIVELFIEDFDNYCAGRPLKRGVALQQGY